LAVLADVTMTDDIVRTDGVRCIVTDKGGVVLKFTNTEIPPIGFTAGEAEKLGSTISSQAHEAKHGINGNDE